jgi:thiol:disulfide interchange protein DsbC
MEIKRLFRTAALLSALAAALAAPALAASDKPLTVDEAAVLLKQLSAQIEVVSVKPAPVEGLWEVAVKVRGQVNVLYVDSSKANVFVGSIIHVPSKLDLTKASLDEMTKVDFAQVPLGDAIAMGKREAKHKVVVFDDPD